MLSDAQLAQMERDGLVTIDAGFTPEEVAAAAAAADRMFDPKPEGFVGSGILAPELLHLMIHPSVEAAARRMLRAQGVVLRAVALRKTAPRLDGQGGLEGEHADVRFTAEDLDATPRRILCTILIWLTDVTERRAPFMFRPGSHRQLAQAWAEPGRVDAFPFDKLPKLPYAEPVPALAKAGQISVGSTGVIHSGSRNIDTKDRKVIFTQWEARETPRPVPFNEGTQAEMDRYFAQAKPLLHPTRRHLIPEPMIQGA